MNSLPRLQHVLLEPYNHYWPCNEQSEEVTYKLREQKQEDRKASKSNAKPKQKIKLKKLKRTQKVRSDGLKKTVYYPKSVEHFGGIIG